MLHKSYLKSTPRLTNIHHEKRKHTLGTWSGKIGKLFTDFTTEFYKSLLLGLIKNKRKHQKHQIVDELLKSDRSNNNNLNNFKNNFKNNLNNLNLNDNNNDNDDNVVD